MNFWAKAYFSLVCCILLLWLLSHRFTASGRAPLNSRPRRIASLSLATDEILLALLEPDRILALTPMADDPNISNVVADASKIPRRITADPEQVAALAPDLVLATQFSRSEPMRQIRALGITVLRLEHSESLAEIKDNILTLGRRFRRERRAAELVEEMTATLDAASTTAATRPKVRVLLYEPGGFTAGTATIFDEICTICGAVNLAAEAGVYGHGVLSQELAVALNPDVLLRSHYPVPDRPESESWTDVTTNPAWNAVAAVRARRLHSMPPKHLTSISQYVVGTAEDLSSVLSRNPSFDQTDNKRGDQHLHIVHGGRNGDNPARLELQGGISQ